MSMSTQHTGGNRKPGKPAVGGTPKPGEGDTEAKTTDAAKATPKAAKADGASRAGAGKGTPAGKGAAGRPGTRPGGAGPRRPSAPVKVAESRPWGLIAMITAAVLIAVGIIGFAGYQVYQNGLSWQQRLGRIDGVKDYRKSDPKVIASGQHAWGPLKYDQSPPVAGTHNFNWQNCLGDVYDQPIANEHAVHSMEHGTVWVTYNPDKVKGADVEKLAKLVRGKEYTMMSPYPGLDKAVSVQAWGYQLKVDSADDSRIKDFIKALRRNASVEPGATCSGGITATGTTPRDLGKEQQEAQQQGQQPTQPGANAPAPAPTQSGQ